METDELYGIECEDVETARAAIEPLLGIKFVAHESSYRGGPYYRSEVGGECFVLQRNWDLLDDQPEEEEFREWKVLLYIEATARPEELEGMLKRGEVKIKLLRRERI